MMRNSALLIIDVQNAMFNESEPVFEGEQLINVISSLIINARKKNVPVFYVQHSSKPGTPLEFGTKGWEIHSTIQPLENEIIIHKKTPDSFYNTDLDDELKNMNIDTLIVAGIQTEVCVDTTCRSAYSHGYKTTLVEDGHSTWNSSVLSAPEIIAHHNTVLRWFSSIVKSDEVEF